jgi:outer membrane protein assembly factor BamB/tetratricopeptide (TPR) repeat protein
MSKTRLRCAALLLLTAAFATGSGADEFTPTRPSDEIYPEYKNYVPTFLKFLPKSKDADYSPPIGQPRGWYKDPDAMKLSSEPSFFTLSSGTGLVMDDEMDGYVKVARQYEAAGNTRKALETYLELFDKRLNRAPNDILYRVSDYGVFVPMRQYCQRRILNLPPMELEHFRKLTDASAQEAFEQARRQNSLMGLANVADTMLATSYGDQALLELGNAELDNRNYLTALEYYETVLGFSKTSKCRTPELDLKIAYCRKMIGDPSSAPVATEKSRLASADLEKLKGLVSAAAYDKPKVVSQLSSAPNLACDDYTGFAPVEDPKALKEPVWKFSPAGSRKDYFVYTQPVVTGNSLIYRSKNIIYCHSLITGELRWVNDTGGIVRLQNWREMMHPPEDVLVKDGMVFTAMQKVGPSLVALDEVSGQLRWSHGPMAASTSDEAKMRFEAAPAAGERTIVAGYVLDNIEGPTHINTEYGVVAYETTTGRQQWRVPLCNLAPGKPTVGLANVRRNHIRSFSSPHLYHQGTVYYGTNAGVIAALDGRSGRVKWYMRYPYHPDVHDARRLFAGGPEGNVPHGGGLPLRPDPIYWMPQRPLIIGDKLYVVPVDSPLLLCLDRRTGKEIWSTPWGTNGFKYFLGAMSTGQLVVVGNGRNQQTRWGYVPGAVWLLNPDTGKVEWNSPDLIMNDDHPTMKIWWYDGPGWDMNHRFFQNAARPFLDSDDNLCITNWTDPSPWWRPGCHVYHLASVSLKDKKILHQRRYYTGELLSLTDIWIRGTDESAVWMKSAPTQLAVLEAVPIKDANTIERIKWAQEMVKDTTPVNEHGPFMPFSRMTFSRFGTQFEVRFGPREVSLVYSRDAVKKAVEQRRDPDALFAKAELALGESRLDDAASLLNQCLTAISSEDLDFRALVNQQLFHVHQRLAQRGIFRGKPDEELENCLGLSRTASTISEEIETLFALADAYERRGNLDAAARCLKNAIAVYGQREYPVSALAGVDRKLAENAATQVLEKSKAIVNPDFYPKEMKRSLTALKNGASLYFSTLSPAPKTLTIRAGELAAARLAALQQRSPDVARAFEAAAGKELAPASPEEQMQRIGEFPASPTAQRLLDGLFHTIDGTKDELTCRKMFALADAARVGGLNVPEAYRARVFAPQATENVRAMALPFGKEVVQDLTTELDPERLLLERKDGSTEHANLVFIGARVKKKSGYKYTLACQDLNDRGKQLWRTEEMRLGNKLQQAGTPGADESGFFEAFVHKDMVIVHGLTNVLAFGLEDGKQRWKFDVPFDFEIRYAVRSGSVLAIAGQSETIALNLETAGGAGEILWQEKEAGDLYSAPYFHADRLISVRKLPFNVTARFRGTGKLIGRLALPDLSLNDEHPLVEDGPHELPVARDEHMLFVTDQSYYIAMDVHRMAVVWKRLIDTNDPTREPRMRFYAKGKYLGVLKEDFADKSFHMLDGRTGDLLWTSDPKDGQAPLPSYSVVMDGTRMYGIGLHQGQGYKITAYDCATGKRLWGPVNQDGFEQKPKVFFTPQVFEKHLVAQVEDGRTFEMRVYDTATGKMVHKFSKKGDGPLGVHGRVSGIVQNGRLGFLTKEEFALCLP